MAFKLAVLAAVLAVARAGYLGAPAVAYGAAPAYAAPAYAAYGAHAVAPAAITSQHSNILRSYGNLGQVSTYSKTIDTPYSSVTKSDVRVSNDALAHVAAPVAYAAHAAPVAYAAHAAPVAYAAHAAPVAYAARPAVVKAAAPAVGLLGVAYSAAPAVAHMTYSNGLGLSYAW
ncbi:cuticle protein 67-like [Schistocerca serialis cubense]|uniref:cuticle protein 67-like n=1 Tax=Schistocerca serialis cubense TaxID=2023355 RepID=UPI00214F49ED|nr:cuticle protein 67-like [Schistocerca serialis cubense]